MQLGLCVKKKSELDGRGEDIGSVGCGGGKMGTALGWKKRKLKNQMVEGLFWPVLCEEEKK